MNTTFTTAFDSITNEVSFNLNWKNGTGYLDNAVTEKELGLKPGEYAKTTDDYGRKVILLNTRFGNIVVFERHSNNSGTIVTNMPRAVSSMCPTAQGALSAEMIEHLIGFPDQVWSLNLGQAIEHLIESAFAKQKEELIKAAQDLHSELKAI